MKVISRPFYVPKWGVRASEPDEIPIEWKVFFRSAVNLTMPFLWSTPMYEPLTK
jgi:hypothetical protein